MPDMFGATEEEIEHYRSVLSQTRVVLLKTKANPFNQEEFDKELKRLIEIYHKMTNTHLSKGLPLNQIYDVFQNQHRNGLIGQIEQEITNGQASLDTMIEIRKKRKASMKPKS